MSDQLFKVGERVGLVSRMLPHLNGEYIVEDVLPHGKLYTDRMNGKKYRKSGELFGYRFTQVIPSPRDNGEAVFAESALRKIHKPSQFSFDELMQELKNTNKIEV